MTEGAWLYILRCSDGSYYIGTTRTALAIRIAQHNDGTFGGYTSSRRPATLIFSEWFERIVDAKTERVEPGQEEGFYMRRLRGSSQTGWA